MKSIIAVSIMLFAVAYAQFAAIDGSNNGNAQGAAGVVQNRISPVAYEDGMGVPRGGLMPSTLPSARLVSNTVAAGTSDPSATSNSDWHTFWGQFLDHDLTLVEEDAADPFNIPVPMDDTVFTMDLPFVRSEHTTINGVNQHTNLITSYIDASNVYGSTTAVASALRSMSGGRLNVNGNDDGVLPTTSEVVISMANLGIAGATIFAAGDVRANENAALCAVHTLWVREHNRQADALAADSDGPCQPDNTDECLYQEARRRVIALHQVIFEQEFAPRVFGSNGLSATTTYDAAVNATVSNEFGLLYRWGHSALNDQIMRDDLGGETFDALNLNQVFFNTMIEDSRDVNALLGGISRQVAREVDVVNVDAIRNTLFMEAAANTQAMDLIARNLQRGRDHGMGSLNTVRDALGLAVRTDFTWCDTQANCDNLDTAYNGTIDDVDTWIGALAEPHSMGGILGETLRAVTLTQFNNLRDGDQYWYSHSDSPNAFTTAEIAEFRDTSLTDVIFRNALEIRELPCEAMTVGGMSCTNPNDEDSDSSASTLAVSAAAAAAAAALLF